MNKLAAKGYVSSNELDKVRRAKDVAFQQVHSAQVQLDEAKNSDRIELRHKYAAALRQTEQQLIELQVQVDDLLVKASVDGEVGPMPAEVGELFNTIVPC